MSRVLLVDDEQNVLNALRRELEDGYEIEMFSNPAEALRRCEECSFDLVIADYKMPEMNGIDFLRQFGKSQPTAVRLVLSGQADTEVLARSINEAHVYRFIDKPWDRAELAGTMAQALAYRKALLEGQQKNGVARSDVLKRLAQESRRYQILVVDEEPNVLSAVTRDLTSRSIFQELHMERLREEASDFSVNSIDMRFDVHGAQSAQQGLDFARRINCDVVIVDYLMPEMNGIEFLEAFRKTQPDAVRIMLSGHSDKHTLVDAINNLEIFSFIGKPWSEYQLKNTVVQAIAYKDMMLHNQQSAQQYA